MLVHKKNNLAGTMFREYDDDKKKLLDVIAFPYFINRDISWLSFNKRLLMEADKESVPLLERLKFLSIFSSNLDEFYRVRIPALAALHKIRKKKPDKSIVQEITHIVHQQQEWFGSLLTCKIIPHLKEKEIYLVYNEQIPEAIKNKAITYFFETIAAFIKIIYLKKPGDFFPENNRLYLVITMIRDEDEEVALVNIPSDHIGRFYTAKQQGTDYVIFTDDVIRQCLPFLFADDEITGAYSIKITRDAELDLQDEYEYDIADKIEQQIHRRDFGLATRVLYQPGLPERVLDQLIDVFNLAHANIMTGGRYHNLKDFATLPAFSPSLYYPKHQAAEYSFRNGNSLFDEIQDHDILIHTPYQSYNTVLRFFNEAALDHEVEEIYTTLYRVASESQIAHALISAASRGKKVTVFVELKARFDEANNIKWGKKMKAAGIKVIYSIPGLKVHAKVALVKKRRQTYLGMLATGNLNENTARFYTDHILLTARSEMLQELEMLFSFLGHRKKAENPAAICFEHLLVAQFNLHEKFLDLIETEIYNAKMGRPSEITIKLNNLEEKTLISKLYEASNAGVKIQLLVRSVCCLVPGVPGMSENIVVKRIVDRYLEHGRIFVFHNNNNELIYLGSSDWMNRNIYHRIEVCFPLNDESLKKEIKTILLLQLQDSESAVLLDTEMNNSRIESNGRKIRSQEEIYNYCKGNGEWAMGNGQ